jgi:hypothetical protein
MSLRRGADRPAPVSRSPTRAGQAPKSAAIADGEQALDLAEQSTQASNGGARTGPVILLSYPYSGAGRVQRFLGATTGLACTSGTGIIPLCDAAAQTWRRIDGLDERALSRLAVTTIRGLVTAQVTAILANAGKKRWCELATSDPSAAQSFVKAIPGAAVVCVHRGCLETIRAWITASPWGLHGAGLAPYLLAYPGNSVAAVAACWANSTDALLAFEAANPQVARRIRSEDVTAAPSEAVAELLPWLGLDGRQAGLAEPVLHDDSAAVAAPSAEPAMPVQMIPPQLRERIGRLHATLGYAPLPG